MKISEKAFHLTSVLILVAYVAIHSFAVTAPIFAADDAQEIAFVNGIDAWWRLFGPDAFGLFRPVKNILFAAFSSQIVVFRTIAVLLGCASFFPVRAFFRRVLTDDGLALAATAIWLLAPTLVSSAVWLSCVNIQVMSALAAMAFVCHDRGRTGLATGCIVVACLSYECAVVIGPALVLFDFFLRPTCVRTRTAWLRYVVYATVTLVFLGVRHAVGAASSVNGSFYGTGRLDLVIASAYFTLLHFGTWLWPFGRMAVFGGYVRGDVSLAVLVACWGVIAAFLGMSWLSRRTRPALAFGLALALIGFLPVSNVTGVGNGPYGDYYLGIASFGLALVWVEVFRVVSAARARLPLVSFTLLALMVVSRVTTIPEAARWAWLWADADRAYEETERTFPRSFHTAICRAQCACDAGDWQTALAQCDRAESIVGTNSSKRVSLLMVRALVALNGTKDAGAALSAIEQALSIPGVMPSDVRQCRFYRGCVYEDLKGDVVRAEAEYTAAIPEKWNVDTIRPADRLARLKAERGDLKAAVSLWSRALKMKPDDATVAWNLAIASKELSR